MPLLMIDAGPTTADALVTRTGGVPLAPPGTEWPTCASCDGPMQFLAQVLLNDADNGTGLLALFACQNEPGMCDDWDPTAGGNRALLFPATDLQPLPLPERAGTDEPVLFLDAVGAVAIAHEDGPDYDTAREAWTARTGRPPSAVLGRLGGSPDWIQGDETPSCPGCDRPLGVAVQLEEGPDRATAMNFGGGGRAFAFTCGPCARAVLLWQC